MEKVNFTIVSRPCEIVFICPYCEEEIRISWDDVDHPEYWCDEWPDALCPECGKYVSLEEWVYD